MQFIYPDTPQYKEIEALKNELLIDGPSFPMNIFKDDWKFLSPQYAEVFGQKDGIFHTKIAAFLESKKQEHYYILHDCDILHSRDMKETYYLPVAKLLTADTQKSYDMVWTKEHGAEKLKYTMIPQLFLFANEHKDWIIFDMVDPGITFLGYKNTEDGEKLLKYFDGYKYLDAAAVEDELRYFNKEAKEQFIINYLSALHVPGSL